MEKDKTTLDKILELSNTNKVLEAKVLDAETQKAQLLSVNKALNNDLNDPNVLNNMVPLNNETLSKTNYTAVRQQFLNTFTNASIQGSTSDNNFASSPYYQSYLLVLARMRYFANSIYWKTENLQLDKALKETFNSLAFDGETFLAYNKKDKKFLNITKFELKYDDYNEIDYKKSKFSFSPKQPSDSKEKELNNNEWDFFHIQLNYAKFGVWVLCWYYLQSAVNIINQTYNLSQVYSKSFAIKEISQSVNNPTVAWLNEPNQPYFKIKVSDKEDFSLEDIFLQTKWDTSTFEKLWLQLNNYLAFWDEAVGIRTNPIDNNTSVRATSGEMLPNSNKADFAEFERSKYYLFFFKEIEAKTGEIVDWELNTSSFTESNLENKPEINEAEDVETNEPNNNN